MAIAIYLFSLLCSQSPHTSNCLVATTTETHIQRRTLRSMNSDVGMCIAYTNGITDHADDMRVYAPLTIGNVSYIVYEVRYVQSGGSYNPPASTPGFVVLARDRTSKIVIVEGDRAALNGPLSFKIGAMMDRK